MYKSYVEHGRGWGGRRATGRRRMYNEHVLRHITTPFPKDVNTCTYGHQLCYRIYLVPLTKQILKITIKRQEWTGIRQA